MNYLFFIRRKKELCDILRQRMSHPLHQSAISNKISSAQPGTSALCRLQIEDYYRDKTMSQEDAPMLDLEAGETTILLPKGDAEEEPEKEKSFISQDIKEKVSST